MLLNIKTHKNQVIFKKSILNPFFIIEKATFAFQNTNELMSNSYFINE